jgi:flavodoxin I
LRTFIKKLIIYDSQYGNTELIALSMGLQIDAEVKRPRFGVITGEEIGAFDLLIVGSPTQQGAPLASITILLDAIPAGGLKYTWVAVFDTRHKWRFVSPWGYAAPRLAKIMEEKGGKLLAPPEGFLVNATRGPVRNGEMDRASAWAKSLLSLMPAGL